MLSDGRAMYTCDEHVSIREGLCKPMGWIEIATQHVNKSEARYTTSGVPFVRRSIQQLRCGMELMHELCFKGISKWGPRLRLV